PPGTSSGSLRVNARVRASGNPPRFGGRVGPRPNRRRRHAAAQVHPPPEERRQTRRGPQGWRAQEHGRHEALGRRHGGETRRGPRQTEDLRKDPEQLLGRSRDQLEDATGDARKQARKGATRARRQPSVDRVLREVDRGRRAAGLPPSFPVLGYDDLSAAQIGERLEDLSAAELRKVRDYEGRNANRKSVR